MRIHLCRWLAALAIGMSLAGCGGGGGGGTTRTAVPVSVDIRWPARSRTIAGPTTALSAVITLRNANPQGGDFVWVVNRDSNLGLHITRYTSENLVKIGSWPMTINFFANADGAGANVGTTSIDVTLTPDGAMQKSDGTDLGDISIAGIVSSVAIQPGQSLVVGDSMDLAFTAYDGEGDPIALSPGSAFFSVTSGVDKLWVDVSGHATGKLPGLATVTVTVEGKTSVAQQVRVLSLAQVSVTPKNVSLSVGQTTTFQASVTNATNNTVTWSVTEGAAGGTITAAGLYAAPTTPGVYHVVATSNFDPGRSDTATVTVQAGGIDVSIQ